MLSSRGYFPTQGLNTYLLHLLLCRWILYPCATREIPSTWMGSHIRKGQPFPGPGEMVLCSCEERGSLELEHDSYFTPASV